MIPKVDAADVYVTLAAPDLGVWNPFSWYPYVPPAKWAAIVTLATDGIIEVQPYVNRERIEYVRVLDYGLTGIIQSGPDRRIGSNVR